MSKPAHDSPGRPQCGDRKTVSAMITSGSATANPDTSLPKYQRGNHGIRKMPAERTYSLMIDLHCHILPGLDDGAKDWPTTLEMCRLARQDGITHIVATPHANARYQSDRRAHQTLLDELQAKVPDLTFSLGCDFQLSYENVAAAVQGPHQFTIGDTCF